MVAEQVTIPGDLLRSWDSPFPPRLFSRAMASASTDDPMGEMNGMMQSIIATVQALGEQVNSIGGRVVGAGNLDEIRVTLADIELKISDYRNTPTRGTGHLSLINPKDLKVRDFDGEENCFMIF